MAQAGFTPISLYYSSTPAAAPIAGNLVNGELAINIADGKLYYKDAGGVVQSISGATATYTRTSFTATAAQTTFTVSYTVGFVQVYLNGVFLNGTDFTATNGTTVVLATGAAAGDIVEVIAYNISNIGVASTATNLAGGIASQIPYQSAAGTTAFIANGTSGQALVSNGTSAPSFGTLGVAGGGTGATTLTANNVLLGNGTSALQVVAPGTNGNVLVSNGTTWTSAAPAASGAKAADVQTFTSSGTWTKPTGFGAKARVLIQVWGAGGSGARGANSYIPGNNGGGGGGGGAYNYRWINLSALSATETATVGAGGAARTSQNQNGLVGGTSSLGSLVFAYGGGPGGTNSYGGGGGGQLSAGANTLPGGPGYNQQGGSQVSPSFIPDGYGGQSYTSAIASTSGMSALYKGGGGGAQNVTINCCGNIPAAGRPGGDSVWGGGGGGGANGGTGGASSFGGSGGAAVTAGTQPGGGGGGGGSGNNSGAGGDGQIIVTVFDGA